MRNSTRANPLLAKVSKANWPNNNNFLITAICRDCSHGNSNVNRRMGSKRLLSAILHCASTDVSEVVFVSSEIAKQRSYLRCFYHPLVQLPSYEAAHYASRSARWRYTYFSAIAPSLPKATLGRKYGFR